MFKYFVQKKKRLVFYALVYTLLFLDEWQLYKFWLLYMYYEFNGDGVYILLKKKVILLFLDWKIRMSVFSKCVERIL